MDEILFIVVSVLAFAICAMAKFTHDFLKIIEEQSYELKSHKKQIIKANPVSIVDHSPFIKVAIEIIRMKKRLEKTESNKDKKHLQKSLERLEEYFKEKGYELINYEGVAYYEGMNVIANFVPSDTMKRGESIITKMIKPQINYKNSMIHSAEVEVSYGD